MLSVLRRRTPAVQRLHDELRAQGRRRSEPLRLQAAEELLQRKITLAELIGVQLGGSGSACAGCSVGQDGKAGCFDGGLCCSGATEVVFAKSEIAALALTGTRPRDCIPSGEDAGCAFRGARGCVLDVRHRPSVCVHYICRDLMREVSEEGVVAEVVVAQDRLREAMEVFSRLNGQSQADEEFAELFPAPRRP